MKRFIYPILQCSSFVLNKWMGNFNDCIWLIGDGRSGTTWISALLNSSGMRREIFEPLHPDYVEYQAKYKGYHYLGFQDECPELKAFYQRVFSGDFRSFWADRGGLRFRYKGVVVKDIFASLLAESIIPQFPNVKPIWLVRHPFAVADSKVKTAKKGYKWNLDLNVFLEQPRLIDRFLSPYSKMVRNINYSDSDFLKYVVTWCIINFLPLHGNLQREVPIVFFERIVSGETDQIEAISGTQIDWQKFYTPSKLASDDFRGPRIKSVEELCHGLNKSEIEDANFVLDQFNLSSIYAEPAKPKLPSYTKSGRKFSS